MISVIFSVLGILGLLEAVRWNVKVFVDEVFSVADNVRVVPGDMVSLGLGQQAALCAAVSLHPVKGTDFTVVVLGSPAPAPGLDRLGDGGHLVLLSAVGVLAVFVCFDGERGANDDLAVVLWTWLRESYLNCSK